MGGSNPPKPPDPVKTAQAQTATNVSTAVANQALQNQNQFTPYGSITYKQTGSQQIFDPTTQSMVSVPTTTATQALSPREQGLYNAQNTASTNMAKLAGQQSARVGSILGKPVSLGGAPPVGQPNIQTMGGGPTIATGIENAGNITKSYGSNDYSADRTKVEQALMSRMAPQLADARQREIAALSNQGIKSGTEAFDRQMNLLGQNENDASMQAILAGGQEQSRLTGLEAGRAAFQNQAQAQQFGQNATRSQFSNDAKQQMFQNNATRLGFNNTAAQQGYQNRVGARKDYLSEQYASRNQPINEIGALLGTGQVQNPMAFAGQQPQIPTVDYAGLVNANYGQKMQNWQTKQQNNPMNGIMGGLFGLGSAGIMASDERLKENIEPVGAELEGNPVYEYSYNGDPDTRHVGVMAQDVLKTRPDAVVPMGKYLGVNYRKLGVA
jgi:hypothetical protein